MDWRIFDWEAIVHDVISVREAALRLEVSTRTVQRWVLNGKLEGRKLDPEIRTSPMIVDAESVEAVLAEQQNTT